MQRKKKTKTKAKRKVAEQEEYTRDLTRRGDFESVWQAPYIVTTHELSPKMPRIYAPKGCCSQAHEMFAPTPTKLVIVWVLAPGEKL